MLFALALLTSLAPWGPGPSIPGSPGLPDGAVILAPRGFEEAGKCYTGTTPENPPGVSAETTHIRITLLHRNCCQALYKVEIFGSPLNSFEMSIHSVTLEWGPPIVVHDNGPLTEDYDLEGGDTVFVVVDVPCGKTYSLEIHGPLGEVCLTTLYCGTSECQIE